jgi:hypothetical protein
MRKFIGTLMTDDAARWSEVPWLLHYGHLFSAGGLDNARAAFRTARVMGLTRKLMPLAMVRPLQTRGGW